LREPLEPLKRRLARGRVGLLFGHRAYLSALYACLVSSLPVSSA
jgi:hypothetical protein